MRAIWSGAISFGMVSIPVRLFTATESHDVSFHLLHKDCGARLKNLRWCPVHEKEVPWEDVERGYEFAKGQYVPITEEDLNRLPISTVHNVNISDFVKLDEVDPIYYEKSYYLAPEETGAKAFVLLKRALEETRRAAVAKVAIRDKESLCLVRPYGDALALETMFYADEVRPVKDLDLPDINKIRVSSRELEMAVSLIGNLSDTFDVTRYEDEYRAALQKLIAAKVEGAPAPEAPAEQPGKLVDLMAALKASIEATQKKPAGEARPAASRRGSSRTAAVASSRRRPKTA